MGIEEELSAKIGELGEKIKLAKADKKPKEEWEHFLTEMLALKVIMKQVCLPFVIKETRMTHTSTLYCYCTVQDKFKQETGKEFGPPPKQDKAKAAPQESSAKNAAKNEAKKKAKAEKEAKKKANREERELREREKAAKLAGVGQDNFGDAPLMQSASMTDRIWTSVEDLKPVLAGREVLVRGHVQTTRGVGKGVFVLIRSALYSVQGVCFENKDIPKEMIKYIDNIPAESVVDVKGIITVPEQPVESATQKMVEIQITSFHCVSKVQAALPFQMEDACRPESGKETDVGAYNEDDEVEVEEDGIVRVGQKVRLDYRWLDLRTPANQSIFRIESMVGVLFRENLVRKNFVEIHTPKLIGGASEGGSDVFTLDYFGQPACLAMSPQLHKQMTAACSGFGRVFETGPVFRAENSNTRRHLCEFTGFDMEMVIEEHYDEILEVFSDLFIYIFDGINEQCKNELEQVRQQHPFEDLKYLRPTLKITYAEGCALLREAGIPQVSVLCDLTCR